jgi:hypothetical protein
VTASLNFYLNGRKNLYESPKSMSLRVIVCNDAMLQLIRYDDIYDDIRSEIMFSMVVVNFYPSRNAAIVPSIIENYGNRLYSTSFRGTRTIKGVREGYSTRNRRFTSSRFTSRKRRFFGCSPGSVVFHNRRLPEKSAILYSYV